MKYRTDLAIERKEILDEEHGGKREIDGIELEKVTYDEDIESTRIRILNEEGEAQLEKPRGYVYYH